MYTLIYDQLKKKIDFHYNTIVDLQTPLSASVYKFAVLDLDGQYKDVTVLRTLGNQGTTLPWPRGLDDLRPDIVWSSVEQFVQFAISWHKQRLERSNLVASDTQVSYYVDSKDLQRKKSTLLDIQKMLDDAGVARAIH